MGRPLLYPKDQTPGCSREAHNFQVDQPKYAERSAVVLGEVLDSVDSHKKFCAKEGLNFKLLSDAEPQGDRLVRIVDQSRRGEVCRPPHLS